MNICIEFNVMKVLPFKIQKLATASLVVQIDAGLSFYQRLHSHEDIQISVFEKGSGTYIIGNDLGVFSAGDVFIIGAQIPHVFKINGNDKNTVKMRSVFFTQTTFGAEFFDLPEMISLKKLFFNQELAYKVTGKGTDFLKMLTDLNQSDAYEKIIIFLKLLKRLSDVPLKTLSTTNVSKKISESSGKRMDAVYQYIFKNFKSTIKLENVAAIAAMSKPAFCRYFKQQTNKTFVQFLNALRIGEACILLQNKDCVIQSVCYACGFNNLANFNRTFKAIKGLSPSEYRKKIGK